MDKNKALEIFALLQGKALAGWEVKSFQDNGKSAAVFKAERNGEMAAVKVFDTDLIERFGGETLIVRSEREKLLLGHDHPHLVQMLDAGVCPETGFHFLVMEFLTGQSMADCIDHIPDEAIPTIIEQLASAAKFLEDRSLCHRDIKPANIMMADDFRSATLLDLGVLKPIGEDGLTDNGGPTLFVGTNQYASPEFALRHEINSLEGYRALTFYQLGAVLHDLIMKTPIFAEHIGVPARLAHAVQSQIIEIKSATVDPWIVTLAQNCLVKSPDTRRRLVSWDSFHPKAAKTDLAMELRERIRQRASAAATIEDEKRKYRHQPDDGKEAISRIIVNMIMAQLRQIGRNDPPLGRRIVYEVGAEKLVRCDFEPSERLGLSTGLTVCIRPEVIDVTSRVVSISGGHTSETVPGEWCPTDWATIDEGPIDEMAVEQQVALLVLSGVDTAQADVAAGGK